MSGGGAIGGGGGSGTVGYGPSGKWSVIGVVATRVCWGFVSWGGIDIVWCMGYHSWGTSGAAAWWIA